MSEYEETSEVTVVSVSDGGNNSQAMAERASERAFHAEREDRRIALSFAMTGYERAGYGNKHPGDKRKPEEIVAAAEKYHAFLVAGRGAK